MDWPGPRSRTFAIGPLLLHVEQDPSLSTWSLLKVQLQLNVVVALVAAMNATLQIKAHATNISTATMPLLMEKRAQVRQIKDGIGKYDFFLKKKKIWQKLNNDQKLRIITKKKNSWVLLEDCNLIRQLATSFDKLYPLSDLQMVLYGEFKRISVIGPLMNNVEIDQSQSTWSQEWLKNVIALEVLKIVTSQTSTIAMDSSSAQRENLSRYVTE